MEEEAMITAPDSETGPESSAPKKYKQMPSVYTATGMVVDPAAQLHHLPNRHKGSITPRLRWFLELSLSGIGMFVEAYIIITTGQIKTVWHAQYPECWSASSKQECPYNIQCLGLFPNTPTENENGWTPNPDFCVQPDNTFPKGLLCNTNVKSAISYAEFVGIMIGMVSFGYIGDLCGRKFARILTSIVMIVGLVGMTFLQDRGLEGGNDFFIVWSVFFAVFGLGVGGEYPLVASAAAEQRLHSTEEALDPSLTERERRVKIDLTKTVRRGETIAMAFTMQGVGSVAGSLVLIALIYFAQQSNTDCNAPGSNSEGSVTVALDGVWRSFYFIGLLQVLCLFVERSLLATESDDFSRVQRRQERRSGSVSTWRILWFYGPRLMGTAGNWFLWDIGFYGLKLYSGPIFQAINPGGSLFVNNGLILLQGCINLVGYYGAAALIDRKPIGRVRLQMFSFLVMSVLFFATGYIFNDGPMAAIFALFYLASFFGQLGANVTTYVMAAESYPAELRSTLHGLSAFSGKGGALIATIVFGYVSTQVIFFICAGTCIVAFFFTLIFSNDYTHVSSSEHDAQLELFLEGRPEAYMGKLNKPEHLSNYEMWTGRHGKYDPDFVYNLINEYNSTGEYHKPNLDVTASVVQAGGVAKKSFVHSVGFIEN